MLRLEWTRPAARQLQHAQNYYHALNPMAATVMAVRIVDAAKRLCEQPAIGRLGRVAGTREWVVSKTPYLLVYRERGDALEVLHVWHASQDWMPT
jgi:addiction module RelE/StbE family toxin